jgi:RNA polymerase sigma factor (sigma-70 family)
MRKTSSALLRYLGALYGGGALIGCSDGKLLELFVTTHGVVDRSEAEVAFATLMQRHGPMVWQVCRSLVFDDHDAEDAFQASFLVLVQKARSLRACETIGPWLYEVAYRTGLNARAASSRRHAVERAAAATATEVHNARLRGESTDIEELAKLAHQEIMRLPERFRATVVLCDLQGLSYQQAALQLRVPLGTVQSRLARARKRLRDRLTPNRISPIEPDGGVGPAGAIMANVGDFTPSPAPSLQQECSRLCMVMMTEKVGLQAFLTGSVQSLMKEGLRSMSLLKWNGIALIPVTAMILCGVLLWDSTTQGQPRQDTSGQKTAVPVAEKTAKTKAIPAGSGNLIVPAPKEQKAAAGRRKALVFALDQNGKRLPGRLEDPNGPEAEVLVELPWAVVTGTVDHRDIQGRASKGRESSTVTASELYRRVELERQTLSSERVWSDWQPVDIEPKIRIFDNLPEQDVEKTPETLRIDALVDPLPFAKGFTWEGVDAERFVSHPTEKEERDGHPANKASAVEKVQVDERPLDVNGAPPKALAPGGIVQFGGRRIDVDSPRSEPPLLMLRQFDFSVEPGQTYHYRSRLVIWDTRGRRKEVAGTWSEPTGPVTVP